jgi:hypothetical protein
VCTAEDYYSINNDSAYEVIFPIEYQEEHYSKLSTGAVLMLVFIFLLVILAVFSTILEYLIDDDEGLSENFKYLLCFSFIRNSKTILLERKQPNGEKDTLELLNGMRVLSIL